MRESKDSTPRASHMISTLISTITRIVSRGDYMNGLRKDTISNIGRNKWWKILPSVYKVSYLKMMSKLIMDSDIDYHLGDEEFQNTVIGGITKFENFIGEYYSTNYTQGEIAEFPDKLNASIEVSKSRRRFAKLISNTSKYQNNPSVEDSRNRRYTFECPECKEKYGFGSDRCSQGHRVDPEGYPKLLPHSKDAVYHTFKLLDQLATGLALAKKLSDEEQQTLIFSCIIPNTNSGWPKFRKQSPKHYKEDWDDSCNLIGYKQSNEWVTIENVIGMMRYCLANHIALPYVHFARTQGGRHETKHRSVFGSHTPGKYVAAVMAVGKLLGYTKEGVDGKYVFSIGGIPIVAQENWDTMFAKIKERMPLVKDDVVQPIDSATMYRLFGVKTPKECMVDVIGGDFPSYDTGLLAEDFLPYTKHKGMGVFYEYYIQDMKAGEVWVANKVITDIVFKSGMGITSDAGSAFHRDINYGARDYKRKHTKEKVEIYANTNLSDDDLIWVENLTPKDINKFLEPYGLWLKEKDSYRYSEHHYVSFLKVMVGYVFRGASLNVTGDPQSRYYGIAHQERNIEQDIEDKRIIAADLKGIWEVTGNIEIDALISKLASFGNESAAIVHCILSIIKDTTLGKDVILAISHLDLNREYKLYRDDVGISFPPDWLTNVNITDLLTHTEV